MKPTLILILFSLFLSHNLFALNLKKSDFSFALGVQGSAILHKRGITTYNGYQVTPIYSLNLFSKNLLLAGSSLYFKKVLSEKSHIWFRLNGSATPDRPLYYTTTSEEDSILREDTSEFDIIYQYNLKRSSYFRFVFSKDLVAHGGNYMELKTRYNIIDISSRGLVEIGVYGAIGFGDSNHNEYLYGTGANRNGLNNIEYGLSITSTKAIDNLWPTLKLTKFEVLGDENRSAAYVEDKAGFNIEALIAFKVW